MTKSSGMFKADSRVYRWIYTSSCICNNRSATHV